MTFTEQRDLTHAYAATLQPGDVVFVQPLPTVHPRRVVFVERVDGNFRTEDEGYCSIFSLVVPWHFRGEVTDGQVKRLIRTIVREDNGHQLGAFKDGGAKCKVCGAVMAFSDAYDHVVFNEHTLGSFAEPCPALDLDARRAWRAA